MRTFCFTSYTFKGAVPIAAPFFITGNCGKIKEYRLGIILMIEIKL
jgi:hypothetical protein